MATAGGYKLVQTNPVVKTSGAPNRPFGERSCPAGDSLCVDHFRTFGEMISSIRCWAGHTVDMVLMQEDVTVTI
ncbi:hypothetical protein ACGFS9_19275 [Streptomyces sp. NPDC048566]|uniref:hypothetical protein n=1 Tax=Streptomyces sp. NPDC048566 TaxID=3365569 RepID=UPI003710AD77